jgi:hypothetical protein
VVCQSFFNELVGTNRTVLDLARGYGEFINAVRAKRKIAVDLNPDAQSFLAPDVTYYRSGRPTSVLPSFVDVVFTSNFLKHLHDT